jgi:hypothetical protein
MHARRAFIHWYGNEGLETVEFDEARSNMTDLIQDYEMYETAGVDEAGEAKCMAFLQSTDRLGLASHFPIENCDCLLLSHYSLFEYVLGFPLV